MISRCRQIIHNTLAEIFTLTLLVSNELRDRYLVLRYLDTKMRFKLAEERTISGYISNRWGKKI